MAKNISSNEVQKLLKKKAFIRASPLVIQSFASANTSANEYYDASAPITRYKRVTQDEFLTELDPRSHAINNTVIYPDKTVKSVIKVDGIDTETTTLVEVARVSVGLQSMIATKQCVHLWAKQPKFTAKRGSNTDDFVRFKEYWTQRNAQSALYLMAKAALTTGDGAAYWFISENGSLNYKVWSYKDGDMLIPIYKENGIDMKFFIRRYYSLPEGEPNAVDTIDVYSDTTYTQLISKGTKWIVTIPERTHGFSQIPVSYHREPDVAWGAGQDLIDKIERLLSDMRESNAYFAFGIMFLSGGDIQVMPPKTSQGKLIISEDSSSKAQLLNQTDLSPALKFEYEQYTKQLYRTTGTVVIDPEILKGGDQSGAYIKNLYNDAIQYAMDAKPRWQPVLEKIVSIVKEALEIEDKNINIRALTIISDPDIYVPMNIAEEIRLVNESFTAGTISLQTASETNFISTPDEITRLLSEQKAEEDMKAQQAQDLLQTKLDVTNINPPQPPTL
jgi:hypothetical protein